MAAKTFLRDCYFTELIDNTGGSVCSRISSFKKFEEYLIARGIESINGMVRTEGQFQTWAKVHSLSKQAKLRGSRRLSKIYGRFKKDNLIKELDSKIRFEKDFIL